MEILTKAKDEDDLAPAHRAEGGRLGGELDHDEPWERIFYQQLLGKFNLIMMNLEREFFINSFSASLTWSWTSIWRGRRWARWPRCGSSLWSWCGTPWRCPIQGSTEDRGQFKLWFFLSPLLRGFCFLCQVDSCRWWRGCTQAWQESLRQRCRWGSCWRDSSCPCGWAPGCWQGWTGCPECTPALPASRGLGGKNPKRKNCEISSMFWRRQRL